MNGAPQPTTRSTTPSTTPPRRRRRGAAVSAFRRDVSAHEPVNVTPLIDVVMVLIIFFLIVGNLAVQKRGEVDLPDASARQASRPSNGPSDRPIVIAMASNGDIRLEGVPTLLDAVAPEVTRLLSRSPDRQVQFRADRGLSASFVLPMLRQLRGAGVSGVELAARDAGRASPRPSTSTDP